MTWRGPDCVDIVERAAMRLFEGLFLYCRSRLLDQEEAEQRHGALAPRKADLDCYYLTAKASHKNVYIFWVYSNLYTI